MEVDKKIIERLSSKGILAYIAIKIAEGSSQTTASLADLVKSKTPAVLEGLKEVQTEFPELVTKIDRRWSCGIIKSGEGIVESIPESTERYRAFVDDLKVYWDTLNPSLAFSMDGRDGAAIKQFLQRNRHWTRENWLQALRNRWVSVKHGNASPSERVGSWVVRLDSYFSSPLNEYGKPMEGVLNGKTAEVRGRNKASREQYLATIGR